MAYVYLMYQQLILTPTAAWEARDLVISLRRSIAILNNHSNHIFPFFLQKGPRLSAGSGPTLGPTPHVVSRSLSMPVDYSAGNQPQSPTYPLPTRIPLHVGVLHYSPTQEPFPLLADPARCARGRARVCYSICSICLLLLSQDSRHLSGF